MADATQTTTAPADTAGASQTTTATDTASAAAGTAPAAGGQQQAQAGTVLTDAAKADGASTTATDATKTDDKPVAKAPEAYAEFTLPEGVKLEGEIGDAFKTLAKDLDLTQEQAQKAADFYASRMKAGEQSQQAQLEQASTAWLAETQADKELGGDKLAANVAIAQKALQTFGTQQLRDLLQQTGMGNHPEVIRMFYRAGKTISEDTFVANSKTSSTDQRTAAERLYPNQVH